MKRYLTGIDWIVNSIDYINKAQSGIGNHSELVLELKTPPDSAALKEALDNFNRRFPLLTGYPTRALNLCPYWRIPQQLPYQPLRLETIKLSPEADYLAPLALQVNSPFRNRREHLIFMLVESGQRAFLGMVFDHRLLDAKGAEAFLHCFQQFYENHTPLQLSSSCPSHLNRWTQKLLAGRQVNRFLLRITRQASLRTLPIDLKREPAKFRIIHLDETKSQRLIKKAYAQAGYLMFLPYALAKTIQIMHKTFEANKIPGSKYLIPVPMDQRNIEEAHKESLFNHFSFFMFDIDASKVNDSNWLLAEIKKQMYDQVKAKLPEAILNGSYLFRIAPLAVTNFILKLMSKKSFASFAFSYLSNTYQQSKLLGAAVQNIFHLPRTPKPPGIGVFFTQFENKLNISISYFEGLLSETQIDQIAADLEALADEEG